MAGVKTLFLFTDKYPYGYSEQFIVNEVKYLSEGFDQIVSFPINQTEEKRSHPENLTTHFLFDDVNYSSTSFLKNFFSIFSIYIQELFKAPSKWFYLSKLLFHFKTLHNAFCVAEGLERYIQEQKINANDLLCYSYWFYHWSIVLGILKRKGVIKHSVSRAHMGDLYDELSEGRKIPFQYFKLRNNDQLFSVSQHGADYLKQRYPSVKEKITHAYLGVDPAGENPSTTTDIFTMVSCSTLSARKRVHLIPEILKHLDFKVRWIHFGDGDERARVEKVLEKLPENVQVELKGFTPNEQVKEFYAKESIHLFVNVSEAEGIPVSLMEAASFGIPMLALKVFGNPEIVNAETGILLEKDFDPKVAAEAINAFHQQEGVSRTAVKDFYTQHFHAANNYTNFTKKLLSYLS